MPSRQPATRRQTALGYMTVAIVLGAVAALVLGVRPVDVLGATLGIVALLAAGTALYLLAPEGEDEP